MQVDNTLHTVLHCIVPGQTCVVVVDAPAVAATPVAVAPVRFKPVAVATALTGTGLTVCPSTASAVAPRRRRSDRSDDSALLASSACALEATVPVLKWTAPDKGPRPSKEQKRRSDVDASV
eukprot:Unigene363_Nuclearia_a/m.1255 Unigene363_Nuclearia_a/g.1255  ORF Unigene363_Nuclearia_a/g.1255 Unigene363_Nuclearia_a/m.1255 type:complete len:121 (-) Unigene363_Nuclearia_a:3-365(-)